MLLHIFGPLALAFDLPDEARGSEPRPVVIASEDGRLISISAAILDPDDGWAGRWPASPNFECVAAEREVGALGRLHLDDVTTGGEPVGLQLEARAAAIRFM